MGILISCRQESGTGFPTKRIFLFKNRSFGGARGCEQQKSWRKLTLSFNLFLGPPPLPPPLHSPQKRYERKNLSYSLPRIIRPYTQTWQATRKRGRGVSRIFLAPTHSIPDLGVHYVGGGGGGAFPREIAYSFEKPSTPQKTKKIIFDTAERRYGTVNCHFPNSTNKKDEA